MAAHPLETGEDIGNRVHPDMSHMKSSGGIWEHGQDEAFGLSRGTPSRALATGLDFCPPSPPFQVNCAQIESGGRLRCGARGSIRRSTADEELAAAAGGQCQRPSQAERRLTDP